MMRKTLTDLLYEYDTKRNRAESLAAAYSARVLAEHPRLRELKAEHDELYLDALKRAMGDPSRREELMSEARRRGDEINILIKA